MTVASRAWNPTLHDGYLRRFSSSLEDATVTLDVVVEHLAQANGKGSTFQIVLKDVIAVCLAQWETPGDLLGDMKQQTEAFRRSRTVTISVEDFAEEGLRINEVILRKTKAKYLTFPKLYWVTDDEEVSLITIEVDGMESKNIGDLTILVAYEEASILRDGEPITTADFIALGRRFWREFAKSG